MNANELETLNNESFHDIVDREVRGTCDEETSAALLDPRVIERFYLELVQSKKSVEAQLGAKRLDVARGVLRLEGSQREAALSDFQRWRAGAIRFKNGVENRMIEIRKLRGRTYPDTEAIKWERNTALAGNYILTEAIRIHRETVLKEFADDEVSDADRALWKAIEH